MKYSSKDQRGFGHVGIVLAIVVIAAVGGAGYFVWHKNQAKTPEAMATKAIQDAIKNAKCDYNDKDLCKFFSSWKAQGSYSVLSTSEADGQKTTTNMQVEGNDAHITVSGAVTYDVISIGQDTYTKAADGTWWKQTTANDTATQYKDNAKVDLKDPDTTTTAASKVTYTKLGKEKCGNLTCFKYQEVDPGDAKTTTLLWFDDHDYQLRRTQTTNEGGTFDATYSYNSVKVGVPSPVKVLGANQYLIPGQSEPTTLPSTGDNPTPEELQSLVDQYQQQ